MAPLGLTARQHELLVFIEKFIAEHGHSPSYTEMGIAIGKVRSRVHSLVNRLIDRGHLRNGKGKYRSIEIVNPSTPRVLIRVSDDGIFLSAAKTGNVTVSVEEVS